ncbi:TetR/AcrR family transcriptional regulator [Anaerobacillus sp. MEB173]|uniref:TetR/AcrR family transcriptional regulator n=1 Tax=Anaerobacillus sp. MEB173 TaxID=3383345 RepID=UPI003F8E491D
MQSKENKRDLIIDAALHVFGEEGYDRATIQAIAKRAGVGKGTTYEYFSSKEELFFETIQSGVSYLMTELEKVLSIEGSIYEQIERLHYRHLELFKSQKQLHKVMMNDLGKIPKDIKYWFLEQEQRLVTMIESVLKKGNESGDIDCANPYLTAYMIMTGLRVVFVYKPKDNEQLEDVIEEQLRQLWNGINTSSTK